MPSDPLRPFIAVRLTYVRIVPLQENSAEKLRDKQNERPKFAYICSKTPILLVARVIWDLVERKLRTVCIEGKTILLVPTVDFTLFSVAVVVHLVSFPIRHPTYDV